MTTTITSNISNLSESAQGIFYELTSLGIEEEKAALIFYRPIGDSILNPTKLQWINRSAFLKAEQKAGQAYANLINLEVPLFTLPKKRLSMQIAATKSFESAVNSLQIIYNDVLKAEQTKKWSYYTGNIYSNSYQYVQDGPWDMDFLPEGVCLKNWEAKLREAKANLK